MRPDHPALIEKGEPARHFENPLNDEHHIGAAGIIFVEAQRNIVLQRPWQNAVAKLGHLQSILDDYRILADEIDSRHGCRDLCGRTAS